MTNKLMLKVNLSGCGKKIAFLRTKLFYAVQGILHVQHLAYIYIRFIELIL